MVNIERVPTGVEGLDELVGGGFAKNSVNILSGPAGSAKTTIGMQFIYKGAKDYGEPGLFLTLEEGRDNIIKAMNGFGMDLEPLMNGGQVYLIDMGGLLREGANVRDEIEREIVGFGALQNFLESFLKHGNIKRIVIDSLTAASLFYKSVEEIRQEMFRFVRFLKKTEVTTILLAESLDQSGEQSRFGVEAFLGDSFIAAGYEKVAGEYRRTIAIVKMRFTDHDPGVHPFLMTSNGIEVSTETEVR
jgi:KaiC/GvpD/RAD55 family RecA-like ATPase